MENPKEIIMKGCYEKIAELINKSIVYNKRQHIDEICCLIRNQISSNKNSIDPLEYINYIERELKRKTKLDIWGAGNPVINNSNGDEFIWYNLANLYAEFSSKVEINREQDEITEKMPYGEMVAKKTKKKGRPKTNIKDKMIDDADGVKLQILHKVIQDKKRKRCNLGDFSCY